jgi:hypothetical protein
MKIDVLIPASPNDNFYSQIAMVRVALDSLGGAYRDARVVAVLGDKAVVPLPDKVGALLRAHRVGTLTLLRRRGKRCWCGSLPRVRRFVRNPAYAAAAPRRAQ